MKITNKNNLITYDFLIAGAGIAGLYTAYRLKQKYPTSRICILEASTYIGGRLHTIEHDGMKFDGGGARFNTQQKRIMNLVKELNLTSKMVPITNDITYKPYKPNYNKQLETRFPQIDDFISFMKEYVQRKQISDTTLINTTIIDFVKDVILKDKEYLDTTSNTSLKTLDIYLTDIYPYYSELKVLNALEGLNLFTHELSPKMQYYVLAGGLQQLSDAIYNKLKKISNVKIFINTPLETITRLTQNNSTSRNKYIITSGNKKFITSNIILAITQPKLLQLKYLTKNKNLLQNIKSIQCEPLYRIYARYPPNPTTAKVWFANMGKMSTNLPIKYIIPVDYEKGIIMISYTDSKFANYWIDKVADTNNDNNTNTNTDTDTTPFEIELTKQLKKLFPDIEIPKPKWYKHCPWVVGAGYWKKGSNREEIMPRMIKPLSADDIFICGENYSSHQAWVEGSLETSNLVLEKIYKLHKHTNKHINTSGGGGESNNKMTKKNKLNTNKETKNKTYTLEEVAKHNKKSDAWIAINGIVADVTNWIPNHPGGNIIMKGVGKDATKMFHALHQHSPDALKMLKKYKIGTLMK